MCILFVKYIGHKSLGMDGRIILKQSQINTVRVWAVAIWLSRGAAMGCSGHAMNLPVRQGVD
jgi:hypothetical protein